MIFDFRLRPPFGEFTQLNLFAPSPCNSRPPQKYHARHTASAFEKSMELFFTEMQEAGIDRGVVMSRVTASKETSVSNECISDLVAIYPDKFVPFGGVALTDGIAAALEEVEKCVKLGFKGIAMEPGYFSPPRKADDATLYPVYARCEQLKFPVVLTLSLYQGPNIDFCSPATVQRIAADFPALQIVVAHACYPWIPQIFSVAGICKNVWLIPDLYMLNPLTPGAEMYENGLRWMDGDRILFGSAYPCYDMRQAVEDLDRFNLTFSQKNKILYDNAQKLLGL